MLFLTGIGGGGAARVGLLIGPMGECGGIIGGGLFGVKGGSVGGAIVGGGSMDSS